MLARLSLLLMAVILSATGLPISDEVSSRLLDVTVKAGVGKYFYNSVASNWTEALKACEDLGGEMAVIDSQQEYDALLELMTQYAVTSVHLGFHDKFTEGVYVTTEDTRWAKNESYWKPGSPGSGSANRNCGGLTTTGAADIACSTNQTTICELRQWSGYTSWNSVSRYNFHGEKRTWADAWDVCNAEGGHLVVVDSADEALEIFKRYTTPLWVGVHRVHGDTDFYTVLNHPLEWTGYSYWGPNYPFGTSASHPYVALDTDSIKTPGLITSTATGQLPFLCETERTD